VEGLATPVPQSPNAHQLILDRQIPRAPPKREFKHFMDANTLAAPQDSRTLRDLEGRTYPEGWANKPVTWYRSMTLEPYAAWAGKRLPQEWDGSTPHKGSDGRT